ncbi:hypothetical protein TrLO_g3589 [Triparma laevis f. longispina]|uniref:START domain-containing protein n=1 Tax=Triparma laevis f. longispina TaxID=1714387 RepID=A0A9W7EFM7_9STRA|nr:hypothetical protein TrLO_g3589 [Triparma laevis f. longispina]
MAGDDALQRVRAIMAKLKDPTAAPQETTSSSADGIVNSNSNYYGPIVVPFTTMTEYEIKRRKDATIRSNNNNRNLPTPGLGYVSSQTKPTKKHNGYAYVMLSYPRYSKGLESSTLEELREWWGLECEVIGVDFTDNICYLNSEVASVKILKPDSKLTTLTRKNPPHLNLYSKVPFDVKSVGVVDVNRENGMGGDYWVYCFDKWEEAYAAEEEVRMGGGVVERGKRVEGFVGLEERRKENGLEESVVEKQNIWAKKIAEEKGKGEEVEVEVEENLTEGLDDFFDSLSIMYKPFYKFVNKLNAKHVHDAPLKEMGEEVHYSVDLFFEYFKQLAKSDAEEAGWTPLDVKDWSGKKKKVKEWLKETGAKAEWRCASGNGPLDQARVTFVVDDELESVLKDINSIKDRHSKSVGSFLYVIDKGEGWRQIYRAIKMPWPTRHRDLVYTEHTVRGEDGEVMVCSRSSKELSESTLELSLQAGRMRAEMRLGGYLLRPVEGGDKTEVIFLSDTDLKGSFAIGYLLRYVTQSYLRGIVDLYRGNAERNKRSGTVSEQPPPPPPLPLVSKALQAMSAKKNGATNPLFAQDGLNIEMGRTIKRQVKKVQKQKKKDEEDIHVL